MSLLDVINSNVHPHPHPEPHVGPRVEYCEEECSVCDEHMCSIDPEHSCGPCDM
jgi:hypothetical protein